MNSRKLARYQNGLLVSALILGMVACCLVQPTYAAQQESAGSRPAPTGEPDASASGFSSSARPAVIQQKNGTVKAKTGCGCSGNSQAARSVQSGNVGQSVLVQEPKLAPKQQEQKPGSQQIGPTDPPGGGGDPDPCDPYITRIKSIKGIGPTTIQVEYELGTNYPTAGCDFPPGAFPFYGVYRMCGANETGVDEQLIHEPLPALTCGVHTIDIDLENPCGKYAVAVSPNGPDCFDTVGGGFTFADGVATFFPIDPFPLMAGGIVPGQCQLRESCPAGCGQANCPAGPNSQGDTVAWCTQIMRPGESFETQSSGGSSCSSCSAGGGSSPVSSDPNVMPTVPMGFEMLTHLSPYQSSLGLGGFMPFDYSCYAMFVEPTNAIAIRMVDACGERVTNFESDPNVVGSMPSPNKLFRSATLLAGTSPTDDLDAATHFEIEGHEGRVFRFEMFQKIGNTETTKDKHGRIESIKNRYDFGYDITYAVSNDYVFDTITDGHGREYEFHYGPDQGGRPAVSSIIMPDGASIQFGYASMVLDQVRIFPNGSSIADWEWTNNVTKSGGKIFMDTVSPIDGARKYEFYEDYQCGSNDYLANPLKTLASVTGPGGVPIMQVGINPSSNPADSDELKIVLGSGGSAGDGTKVGIYKPGHYMKWSENWSFVPGQSNVWNSYAASFPTHIEKNNWSGGVGGTSLVEPLNGNQVSAQTLLPPGFIAGAPISRQTIHGELITIEYDDDYYVTKRTYMDSTFEEFTRNLDKQVTRYRDRIGNVTVLVYDGDGQMIERRVGLKDPGAGPDVQQPEFAIYKYDYDGNSGRVKTEFSPLWNGETDMYRTDYEYYADAPRIGRIKKVIQSADIAGDLRPEINYVWDTASGRLISSEDPVNRLVSLQKDALGRVTQTTFNDNSTEQVLYLTGTQGGLVSATKDRNDVVTSNNYDTWHRLEMRVAGSAIDADILDSMPHDQIVNDVLQKSISDYDYFVATSMPQFITTDGRKTERVVDGMVRAKETKRFPNDSNTIVSKRYFDGYRTQSSEDWLGRRSYTGYDSEGRVVKSIVETIPGGSGLDPLNVSNQNILTKQRDLANNAGYIVTERSYDAESQLLGSTDARDISSSISYDSRGRTYQQISAVGTSVEAKTETDYDVASNVMEVRGPRYFDASDLQAHNIAKTTYAYNGREMPASVSQVLNDSQTAVSSTEYALDGRAIKRTDARGMDWETYWHDCCGRMMGSRDPAGHGSFSNTDYRGSVTHSISVQDYDSHNSNSHDPIDAKTLRETTVKYDALGRKVASCVWLSQRGNIDPNNVPIAGIDADGDTVIDAPLTDGLPSMTFYDTNLTDGIGLDNVLGMAVPQYESALSNLVSIVPLLSQLQVDTGISFAAGSAGSAVLSVNAEEEMSVTISDGMGRTVMVAQVELTAGGLAIPNNLNASSGGILPPTNGETGEPDASASGFSSERHASHKGAKTHQANACGSPFSLSSTSSFSSLSFPGGRGSVRASSTSSLPSSATPRLCETTSSSSATPRLRVTPSSTSLSPITWSYTTYDHSFDLNPQGQPELLAETRSIDALGNITRGRSDGAGRTQQTVDADDNITLMEYDAASNMLNVRDPNAVGYDAIYDDLGRVTSRTDTHNDVTSSTYNKVGNAVTQTDAKLKVTTIEYDAAGRRVKVTDRLAENTAYVYDLGSNLLSITDAEQQTTIYAYDDRGLKLSTLYPDHVAGSVPGDIGYGIVSTAYDALGRAIHARDQKGDWRQHVYDLAGRLTNRQYRTSAAGQWGTISDQDAFVYDNVSRLLSADSGRYNNSVSKTYDNAGRMDSDSLTIAGQTYATGYSHDSRNQLTQVSYPSGHVVDYDYTDRRQLDTIDWQSTQIEDRGYDVGSRMTSIDRAPNGVSIDEIRTYDTANRLMSIDNTGVGKLDYMWDDNGNKLSETWTGAMSAWSFTTEKPGASQYVDGYDEEDRFRRFNRSGQTQELYLDRSAIGNISDVETNSVSLLRTFGDAHELNSVGANNQTFDAKGNVRFTHSGYDLEWDFDNKLKESALGKTVTNYQYDALGRRVKKGSTVYIYGGPNCIAEYTSGTAPASPAQEYVYGDQIDSLVMISRKDDDERLLATRNQQWSIVSLVDIKDSSVVERYTYDHFGARTILAANGSTVLTSSAFNNPYGYTSRRHDDESGLIYFRARYYDSTTGEFTSRDPLEYVDDMSMMRGYMGIDMADPLGKAICKCTTGSWSAGGGYGGYGCSKTSFEYTEGKCSDLDYSRPYSGGGSSRNCSSTSLADDEKSAAALCNGDPECEKTMTALMNLVMNTNSGVLLPRWPFMDPKLEGDGYCYAYLKNVKQACENKWGKWNGNEMNLAGGCTIRLQQVFPKAKKVKTWDTAIGDATGTGVFGWSYGDHGIVEVCCDTDSGKKCMYFDVGSESFTGQFGGDDKWFSPDDENYLDEIDPDKTTFWYD